MASASGAACEQQPPSPNLRAATPVPTTKGKRRPFPLLEVSTMPRDGQKSAVHAENSDIEPGVDDSRRSSMCSASSGADVDAAVAYIRLQNVMQRQKVLVGKTLTNGDQPITPFWPHAPGDHDDTFDITSSLPQTPEDSRSCRDFCHRRISADDLLHLSNSRCGTPSRSSSRRPSNNLMDLVGAGAGSRRNSGLSIPAVDEDSIDQPNGTSCASTAAPVPPKPREIRRCTTAPVTDGLDRMSLDAKEEEAHEAERVGRIMRHLEEMNNSAADLNLVQKDRAECANDRQRLLQLWAVGSARLARAVGSHRLAKARPYYEQRRRCVERQAAVEEASRKFLAASKATVPEVELQDLAAKHAATLERYHEAQCKMSKFQPSKFYAASPYFEAEEEHRAQLQEADAILELCTERVEAAKARYRLALRSLEDLSEQAHRQASLAASGVAATSSQASSPRQSPSGGTARSPVQPVSRRQVTSDQSKRSRKSAPAGIPQVLRQDSQGSQESLEESQDTSEDQSVLPNLHVDARNLESLADAQVRRQFSQGSQDSLEESQDTSEDPGLHPDLQANEKSLESLANATEASTGVVMNSSVLRHEGLAHQELEEQEKEREGYDQEEEGKEQVLEEKEEAKEEKEEKEEEEEKKEDKEEEEKEEKEEEAQEEEQQDE